ncbi:hypothetical protein CPC08DRAFT_371659 [Agrocybe pediades]|nr:hypothetical protein CPC08DRAFT_371659 [Agrocybe pediades]
MMFLPTACPALASRFQYFNNQSFCRRNFLFNVSLLCPGPLSLCCPLLELLRLVAVTLNLTYSVQIHYPSRAFLAFLFSSALGGATILLLWLRFHKDSPHPHCPL